MFSRAAVAARHRQVARPSWPGCVSSPPSRGGAPTRRQSASARAHSDVRSAMAKRGLRSAVGRQTRKPATLTAVVLSRRALPLPIPGRVTDAASGQPLVRVTVALLDSSAANARANGFALSNLPPLTTVPPGPPSPLNVFDRQSGRQPRGSVRRPERHRAGPRVRGDAAAAGLTDGLRVPTRLGSSARW
jgi:hypothetical protein